MSLPHPEALPHAFPFRLVERAEDVGGLRTAVVLASGGGFLAPGTPWPVTLVAEAIAQSILLVAERPVNAGTLRLVGIDGVRLLQPVTAGDRLEIEVRRAAGYAALQRFDCRAVKAGALAAVAEVTVSQS